MKGTKYANFEATYSGVVRAFPVIELMYSVLTERRSTGMALL